MLSGLDRAASYTACNITVKLCEQGEVLQFVHSRASTALRRRMQPATQLCFSAHLERFLLLLKCAGNPEGRSPCDAPRSML